MIQFKNTESARKIFRIDKFNVPAAARAEFLAKVRETHEFLRTLAGFIEDFVLEQVGGPGVFNLVTIVVWENPAVVEAAKMAAAERQKASGFNPAEFIARLGIQADMGNYALIGFWASADKNAPADFPVVSGQSSLRR